jgi:hypothetical protein
MQTEELGPRDPSFYEQNEADARRDVTHVPNPPQPIPAAPAYASILQRLLKRFRRRAK